jgi:hypothetical protein
LNAVDVYFWTARDEQTTGICSRTWRLVKSIFNSADDDGEAREISETEIAIRSMQVDCYLMTDVLLQLHNVVVTSNASRNTRR